MMSGWTCKVQRQENNPRNWNGALNIAKYTQKAKRVKSFRFPQPPKTLKTIVREHAKYSVSCIKSKTRFALVNYWLIF